jgi:hypothetical protein
MENEFSNEQADLKVKLVRMTTICAASGELRATSREQQTNHFFLLITVNLLSTSRSSYHAAS